MKLLGLAVLTMAGVGWGQSFPPMSTAPGCAHYAPGEKHLPNVPACAPLKCGKWQHVEHWEGVCGPSDPSGATITSTNANFICAALPPDHCADDMHQVTEREWQELNERLKKLTDRICVSDSAAVLFDCTKPPRIGRLKALEPRK